jgi:hypothetical protein
LIGNGESLGGCGKGFHGDGRPNAGMQAIAMPVNACALLCVQVGNLDFEAALRCLTRQAPRERGFPNAAFL